VLGFKIGMTHDEVMEHAEDISSAAELSEDGYLYLGGEGAGLKVEFDDDDKLSVIGYSMYYTG